MVRNRRRRQSDCAEHEKSIQKQLCQRSYGLSYVNESGRTSWPLPQRIAFGHCQRLNREEGFLFFDPASPGSPYWGARTTHAYNVLVKLIKSEYLKHGFSEAVTPNMYSGSLWEPYGRWQHFSQEISRIAMMRADMLTVSCSGHCLFYGHRTPSFTELPIRYSDFGVIHRSNGVSNPLPLPYACHLLEDDSHIFCRPDQIAHEIKKCIEFISFLYEKVMKFTVEAELCTRSHDCCLGDAFLWDATEKVLKEEFQRRGRTLKMREGAAPYYGPKINLKLRDPNGLYHIYGSIQLDVEMPEGFDLGYIGDDRKRHRPVLIHRAIVPPAETILAIISTQCGECWPFWLSLHQVNVLPVCTVSIPYARRIAKEFTDANYEVEANFECAGTLNRRIKNSIGSKPNFTLVVGRTEIANGTVNVRTRNDLVLGEFTIKEVLRQFRSFEEDYSTDRQCIEAFMRCRGRERSWFP
ncbi:hypothetical protein V3C99_002455 [Haemonchus contortus]|uniref:Threonyl-tRNA synthetase n=1 Tax=Haemonchus contortus TaxID=6289 RepID=A0A7I5E8R8_HAECO|nr:Aminoacyl-tRNA synthetase and Anticodon-binding domain containing protein [Haemonchus contortus]CDJ94415.1 Aminoacyl-tRNA synthetase and Anticodon-binding domain containing protein [Haemonchus contortus]